MSGGSPERGEESVAVNNRLWVGQRKVHASSSPPNCPVVAHDRFVVPYDADVTDDNSKLAANYPKVGVYP